MLSFTTTQDGKLEVTGSRFSAAALASEAEGFRSSEAVRADTFDGLAAYLGYGARVGTLIKAIGDTTDRAEIVARLSTVIPPYADNLERLADTYLAESGVSAPHLIAAE
jgi:hypothetical protein